MSATSLADLVNTSSIQGNPINIVRTFLEKEHRLEQAREVGKMRFVGYVLELGYDTARIITSDPYKIAVGGIPRGSFLIMAPNNPGNLPTHFTLLRVTGVSPTPLSNQVQQTYFELHKRSMPELDVWTQSELQWGALECDVLGMFYANPEDMSKLSFSGDVNNVVSAHRYKVYSPDDDLLQLIVNGTVQPVQQFDVGILRTMECGLRSAGRHEQTQVMISLRDFMGCRTAMFGKTRLGKSNIVKLIAQGMLDATRKTRNVGQLIFDINGEYANDNPQDGNRSLRSSNEERCDVYALVERPDTPSHPLKLNFYEQPDSCMQIIRSLLEPQYRGTQYVNSFYSVQLPNIEDIKAMPAGSKRTRAVRQIQIYWAILHKSGFDADENRLRALGLTGASTNGPSHFDPHFNGKIIKAVYSGGDAHHPPQDLPALRLHLEKVKEYYDAHKTDPAFQGSKGPVFDPEDEALLEFLSPKTGGGPRVLRPHMIYHDSKAGDIVTHIIGKLEQGNTVILDLGNASDEIRRYFADLLSQAVFRHQEGKFTSNALGNRYVQLYFEEAHNLFPPERKGLTDIYARFAKEGAKFHIGIVYSTQSPSTINSDLLAQTENFFVGHLSSQDEARSLSKVQVAFSGVEQDILRTRTPGFMRMLTLSHRFVIPVQAHKFETSVGDPELTGSE